MHNFYYPIGEEKLQIVNYSEARSLLIKKLKERLTNGGFDEPFSIWSNTNINCYKFTCPEELTEFWSYISCKNLN